MRLGGVHPGDIVRVGGSYALVAEVHDRKVIISWLGRENGGERMIPAREIEAHWRRSRAS